jgi:cold shock CspA family protein
MSEGVITHYLPVRTFFGTKHEKGIDLWLALEAFELAFYKKFDVIVLIASDGDYVPLVRKLNTLGTRVMVLSWDFEFLNDEGQKVITRTSQDLLNEVSYPLHMHELIDSGLADEEESVMKLFVPQTAPRPVNTEPTEVTGERLNGNILSLKNGFGFVKYPPNNLFFHYGNLLDTDFNDLKEGDPVEFTMGYNDKGEAVAKDVRIVSDEVNGNLL